MARQANRCQWIGLSDALEAFVSARGKHQSQGHIRPLHISYPNLVYGFLHVIRANREGLLAPEAEHFLRADAAGNVAANDVAIRADGQPVESIVRYHDVVLGLTGRDGVRNDISRYEALALAIVDPASRAVLAEWPLVDSPLRIEAFMASIYGAYDQRYVYAAPKLAKRTARLTWRSDSPAFVEPVAREFVPRFAD